MTSTDDIRPAFRFFMEHAGYSTPPGRAACALELARAERDMRQAIDDRRAAVVWEWDELEPIVPDGMTDVEYARKLETGEWDGPFVCALEIGGETVAALGGVVLADANPRFGLNLYGTRDDGSQGWSRDPYARVIEAELAAEAADDLRAPISNRADVAPLLDNLLGRVRREGVSA